MLEKDGESRAVLLGPKVRVEARAKDEQVAGAVATRDAFDFAHRDSNLIWTLLHVVGCCDEKLCSVAVLHRRRGYGVHEHEEAKEHSADDHDVLVHWPFEV